MSTVTSCPTSADLQQFLLGKLGQGDAGLIEEHLARCESCSKTLHTLPAEDTMVAAVRQAGKGTPAAIRSPLVSRLIDGIRASGVVETRPAQDDAAELLKRCHPPQSADELGRFGAYRLRRVIGSGGMAVVFLAEDGQLRRLVALKVLKPSVAARPAARERFLREAQAAAAIRHDNVVAIYAVGEEAGIPYMALEYLEGEPLDALLLREGSLPASEAIAIARQIAEGLAAAHLLGLIHRDIKPANIFLVRDAHSSPDGDAFGVTASGSRPHVKVLDFGLARFALDDPQLTQAGTVLGTPAFMSPEQARRETVDRRGDIFSLGSVVYRMCTGFLPFRGTDTMAVLMSLAVDDPEPPHSLNPEIPPALSDLILRMLAKQPADRPGSVAEVINALIDIQQPSSPSGTQRRSGKPPAVSPRRGGTSRSGAPWSGKPLITAAAAMGVFLAAIVATVIYIQTDRGTLIVESTDKNIDVIVEQAGAKIVDRDEGRTFSVRVGPQQLPSGRYRLEVAEGSGLVFGTEKFEITRGGERRVRVSLRQKLASAQSGPPVASNPPAGPVDRGPTIWRWQADDLRLGKIAAPDFSDQEAILDADFAIPEKRLVGTEITTEYFDRSFKDDRYVIRHKGTTTVRSLFSTEPCSRLTQSFAIEVTARVVGSRWVSDSWGLVVAGPEEGGFSLKLSRGGYLTLLGPPKKITAFPGFRPAPIAHTKIDTGDSDNTLLVVLKGRNLEIYVNGGAVVQPVILDRDLLPCDVLLGYYPHVAGSQVEFRRVRLWSADKLPPLAERGAIAESLGAPETPPVTNDRGAAPGSLGQRGAWGEYSEYTSLAFWYTADQLITHNEIVRELKLTADQQESIRRAQAKYQEDRAAIPQRTAQNSEDVWRMAVEAANKRIAAIREALGDKAVRLDQIAAQSAGLAHLFVTRPNLRAPHIGITPDQLAKGREILDSVYQEMPSGDISSKIRRAFVDKSTPELLELLTDEQKQLWQDALGELVHTEILAIVRGGPRQGMESLAAPAPSAPDRPETWTWPAEELRLGKIAAPDFTRDKPLVDVDFAVPEKRMIGDEAETEHFQRLFGGGRYVIRAKKDQFLQFSAEPFARIKRPFALELTARITSVRAGGNAPPGGQDELEREKWGVFLMGEGERGLTLKLARDGTLSFSGPPKRITEFPGPKPPPATHDKIRKGGEDNTLLVVCLGGYLEVYVNGVAVAQPALLSKDFHPDTLMLAFYPNLSGSQVEFGQIRLWSAELLPPLAQRGAVPAASR
jgi:serine/threonine protein kinase